MFLICQPDIRGHEAPHQSSINQSEVTHFGAKQKGEGDGGGELGVDKQDEVQQVGVGGERILQENPANRGTTQLQHYHQQHNHQQHNSTFSKQHRNRQLQPSEMYYNIFPLFSTDERHIVIIHTLFTPSTSQKLGCETGVEIGQKD